MATQIHTLFRNGQKILTDYQEGKFDLAEALTQAIESFNWVTGSNHTTLASTGWVNKVLPGTDFYWFLNFLIYLEKNI